MVAPTTYGAADESEAKERIVYEESVRVLQHQADIADGLRARATSVLAAAALATGLLAPAVLDPRTAAGHGTHLAALSWLALTALLLVIVTAGGALVVRSGWFVYDPHETIGRLLDANPPFSLTTVLRDRSYYNGTLYARNRSRLNLIWAMTTAAAALLGLEILAWVIELARLR